MKKMAIAFFKNKKIILKITILILIVLFFMPIITTKRVKLGNEYVLKEDVSLYIKTYHELPENYITKYGMDTAILHGGDISDKIVGGDTHWDTNELSEFRISDNSHLKECDIKGSTYDLTTSNRGILRLVYTSNTKNVRVFFTEDHYSSYEEISTFQLQLTRNIFWIVFAVYTSGLSTFLICCYYYKKKSEIAENI
jgi:hypothetical protein